ncbi:MAG: glycosyltransferase family 2 protein [Escherichia coli]|nr:glycosyltransferase family 2 protein [Escherichia coli]
MVNEGSTDNTVEVVNNIIDKSKIPIKFIDKPNGGKHSAWRVAKKFLKVVM